MCRFDEWETKEESVKGENDDDEVKDVASGLSCVCVCCLPVANDVAISNNFFPKTHQEKKFL